MDQEHGTGAYKISGGANGGVVILLSFLSIIFLALGIFLLATAGPLLAPVSVALFGTSAFLTAAIAALLILPTDATVNDVLLGIGAAAAVIGGVALLLPSALLGWIAGILSLLSALGSLIENLLVKIVIVRSDLLYAYFFSGGRHGGRVG